MTPAFIGIGSNIGSPEVSIDKALQALNGLPETTLLKRSSLYRSAPIGCPEPQSDYINAVAKVITTLSPLALLKHLQMLEVSAGRIKTAANLPRTLDLDLLSFGDCVQNDPLLTLPHPRLTQRAFVLLPLLEIEPDCQLPVHGALAPYLKLCQNQRIQRLD